MPKVLVTLWTRIRLVYMSPIKHTETYIDNNLSNNVVQYTTVQDIVPDVVSNNTFNSKNHGWKTM